ncbi:hypothetical protein P7C71_g899, partial [Lecanoromycetidae sp. Uapishka_2]
MHSLHPSYMFNAPDITNEYNLLNEFLSSSLLDDASIFPNDEIQALNSDPSLGNTLVASSNGTNGQNLLNPQQSQSAAPAQAFVPGNNISRPRSVRPTDKEEDKYYMTIADPSGNDTPEERMNKVFMAKYNADLKASDPEIKCCFSFTIRRDNHNIPSLIVGNFLPQIPRRA